MTQHVVVTGAFSNIGQAAASELLKRGWKVSTLTGRTPPTGSPIIAHDLRFDSDHLRAALRGASVLVNTYWIRFPHGGITYRDAIDNTLHLFRCAREAGVERIVQVSVSNAAVNCGLPYYEGKAEIESAMPALARSGHAVVRPTLVVGPKDVLTNNMAWFLRRFPVTAVPRGASAEYQIQPITLDETGRLLADAVERNDSYTIDAAGPEVYSFERYLEMLAAAVGRRLRPVRMPARLMHRAVSVLNPFLRDTVLTREELEGLRRNFLVSHDSPTSTVSVADWISRHGAGFGDKYTNDTIARFKVGR